MPPSPGGPLPPLEIPLSRPEIGPEEIDEVVACLRSGWITSGPRVAQLEREFAAAVAATHAVAFSSCTAALHAALLALGVEAGDEVICPALSWASASNMVLACGARPVFADIDPGTWNLDPDAVAGALTERTRVVVPVHYAGQPADLDGLRAVLRDRSRPDVKILEDAAHAAGACYRGEPIGSGALNTAAACFSFHPIKNMTTAEGGMLTTSDAGLAERARRWRFHGVTRDAFAAYRAAAPASDAYDIVLPGFKYNLSDLHAAIGIWQLRKLLGMNERRRALARFYTEKLGALSPIVLLGKAPYPALSSWHIFPILAPASRQGLEASRRARGELAAALRRQGIGTGHHFEAVHLSTCYRERLGMEEGSLPVAEDVCARVISLPLYPSLEEAQAARVVRAIEEHVRRGGG